MAARHGRLGWAFLGAAIVKDGEIIGRPIVDRAQAAVVCRKENSMADGGDATSRIIFSCETSDDTGCVCENHPERPSYCIPTARSCMCSGAGKPCPARNATASGGRPRTPPGFVPAFYPDKGSVH
jgi:hypothetical protein